jgi:hypothetical protein
LPLKYVWIDAELEIIDTAIYYNWCFEDIRLDR